MLISLRVNYPVIIAFLLLMASSTSGANFRDRADLFMESLVSERFDDAVAAFNPSLADKHPVEDLERIWYTTVEKYGPFQNYRFGETLERPMDSEQLSKISPVISYLYVVEYEKGILGVVLSYNEQGRIMTFILQPPGAEPILTQPNWIVPAYTRPELFVYRLPSYVDTSLISEVDFTMQGDIPVPATITAARTNEPNPVVLLFQGFGSTNRDGAVGILKPIRDIAWGLASQGIASIRFDCRAYTQKPEVIAEYNLDEYLLNDIAAMLAYIRMETEIFDTTRIFIAGQGLGGMAAPIAAKRDGGLAGVILLSTPAQSFGDYLMETLRSSEKFSTSDDEKDRALLSGAMEILDLLQKRRLPADEMVLFAPARIWYDIMDEGHVDLIRQTDLPVLIIQCGDDPNISERDYEIWESIAHARKNVSLKMYPDLNYFYQAVIAPESPDDEMIDTSPVDIRIIQDIAFWIKSY